MLRGLIQESNDEWDTKIHKAVVVYNNTVHSQIKCSPSSIILEQSHLPKKVLPVNYKTVNTWKAGNPKFSPYQVDQKVMYQIQRKGNMVIDKLRQKYDGPFEIVKVMPNNVTYQIRRTGVREGKLIKVHYDQLRLYYEISHYLKNIMSGEGRTCNPQDESSCSSSDFPAKFIVS